MRKNPWKVWSSRRRQIYIRIAIKFRSTPWRVYNLGHGGKSKSAKDVKILEELKRQEIITRIYPW